MANPVTPEVGAAVIGAPATPAGGTPATPVDTLYPPPAAAPAGQAPAAPAKSVEDADAGGAAPVTPGAAVEQTPEEKAAAETKAAEDAAAAALPFDPTKVTLPEGVQLDTKAMDLASPMLTELGLNQGQAQKVLDAYMAIRRQELEGGLAATRAWQETAVNDPEFGGDKFAINQAKGNALLEKFGDAELGDYLVTSGLGNHPALFRFVSRLAAAMGEDAPVKSSIAAGPQPKDRLAILYPDAKG